MVCVSTPFLSLSLCKTSTDQAQLHSPLDNGQRNGLVQNGGQDIHERHTLKECGRTINLAPTQIQPLSEFEVSCTP